MVHQGASTELAQAYAKIMLVEQRLAEQERTIRELEQLAATDSMTGLMNRRGFERFFAQEQSRMRRHKTPSSVLMLFDLDKFKQINDTYGHLAGDACLKKVGEFLQSRLRSLDAAARIGGDEFAILLSHTDPNQAANCISEIKNILANLRVDWQEKELHFSASVGYGYVSENTTYEAACQAADQVLYSCKKGKR
jgi:diguanylate cyclase (GGDEF)-like protein